MATARNVYNFIAVTRQYMSETCSVVRSIFKFVHVKRYKFGGAEKCFDDIPCSRYFNLYFISTKCTKTAYCSFSFRVLILLCNQL